MGGQADRCPGIAQAFAPGSPHLEKLIAGIGDAYAQERVARAREIKAAVEETKRWVEGRFESRLLSIEQRSDILREAVGKESVDRAKEINTVVDEAKCAVEDRLEQRLETKLGSVEERIAQDTDQRMSQHIEQCSGRIRTLSDAIATERTDRQKEVRAAVEEARCASETKLTALEERLKAVPGKLPVAKTWRPESVTYQGEFVSFEGETWQAKTDTAQKPGGSDWVCIARAGHDGCDAITPNICGTFDAYGKYKRLDVVAMDSASFVAKYDNPGICPGNGWQMMARQGKPGRKGEPGPRGLEGEKGEPGKDGREIVSWHLDRKTYRFVPFYSDGETGAVIASRGAFEQFQEDSS